MKNIKDLIENYQNDIDVLYQIPDYIYSENSYICDVISEIADNDVDLYYSGLIDWIQNDGGAIQSIENSIREFGVDSQNFDFMKLLQQGQFYQKEQQLYKNLDAIGKIWLLAYLLNKENLQEITDEQAEFIDNLDVDNNDKFGDLLTKWNEYNENND